MGIDLIWLDANGRELDVVADSNGHFADVIERLSHERIAPFPILQSIDPYAVTRFTPPQVTPLLRELEMMRARTVDPAVRITIGHFLSIVRAADNTAGTWLEFVGD